MKCVILFVVAFGAVAVADGAQLRSSNGTGVVNASAADAIANLNLTKAGYPCGKASKITAFSSYRENLLTKVCGLETASGFSCKSNLQCLLNEFYTADCAGLSGKTDTCAKCTSAHEMSAAGFAYQGGFCYDFRTWYEKNYKDYALFQTIMGDELLGKELCCASMIMASDGCASGTTVPSCF